LCDRTPLCCLEMKCYCQIHRDVHKASKI
jgi:hypothetical protein